MKRAARVKKPTSKNVSPISRSSHACLDVILQLQLETAPASSHSRPSFVFQRQCATFSSRLGTASLLILLSLGGIGHMRQLTFSKIKSLHRFSYGGSLRNKRAGRKERPLSSRDPIHLVFKANRRTIPGGLRSPRRYRLIYRVSERYARRFFIGIEHLSIQGDHLHFIVRTSRRSTLQNFLRVFAGQVSQQLANSGLTRSCGVTDTPIITGPGRGSETIGRSNLQKLWKHRPFTRVVKSYRAYRIVRNYVQLNELEAQGKIPYRKTRLRGVLTEEWELLTG